MREERRNIIVSVEKYPCLWDIHDSDYHNREAKEIAWEQVCKKVIHNWDECTDRIEKGAELKKTWANIRDYYRKEVQRSISGSTGSASKKQRYVYNELLQFLTPIFAEKNTRSSSPTENTDHTLELEMTEKENTKLPENYKPTVSSETLIKLIRQRPCLWNKNLSDYKDRAARDAAWTEIYREVVPDFDNCRNTLKKHIGIQLTKKWCNLRDAYVKARHNLRSNKCNKPYIHTKLLSFIDPFITEKHDTTEEAVESEEETTENWYNETVYLEEDEPIPKRPKVEIDTDREDNSNLQMESENIVTLLTRMIQREEDEDRAFFKSIEPSVKALSEDSKLEFRISVLKLIKDLKFREKTGIHVNLKMSVDTD